MQVGNCAEDLVKPFKHLFFVQWGLLGQFCLKVFAVDKVHDQILGIIRLDKVVRHTRQVRVI